MTDRERWNDFLNRYGFTVAATTPTTIFVHVAGNTEFAGNFDPDGNFTGMEVHQ